MPALEPFRGVRVVAMPAALHSARWVGDQIQVLRFAPDEAFAVGATDVAVDDPDAIMEDEVGFVAVTVERAVVERHVDWRLPPDGSLAQGAIAGVPAKLAWLPDGRAWIVTPAAYAAELMDRLR